ncbi:50S ribosomal protein L16 [Candidatus Campbellbacteria bacterium CG11_big_fil_rev_8_21_14_0_20_44_21]|uniref:Large ribosomal subunit protein uL16 n=1 Tax=Candidatus Campbellbacteria bacterium CG22_combo_CG10-13_8_21_14_all_43_18 TaxID=1974530 RepID=A0A2H0DWG7_9BACT|nr:MAG: 50S ribosomal protein L16 [Candidatus Campbellbacteria bacterium CG22_combo_CG10-13_8_21_14_all_43_18]PIR24338.1 MAG: 50S ribosomal protein L16 [Candidatus Campbellbacteria bacterium CG11_big_fil_rev_8_21_14_0_20_44_21]
MLFPKKVKYRKWQSARKNPKKRGLATRGNTVAFGSFGLKALSADRVTSNQIEASRRVIARTLGKFGKVWTRIFPDRPFTKKGAEVPMGKGKGEPQGFVAEVKPGRVLFEVDGVSKEKATEALLKAGKKMPVRTKIVERI